MKIDKDETNDQKGFWAAILRITSVSISKKFLILSSKMATPAMATMKRPRSLYCSTLYLRLSDVGGSTQFFNFRKFFFTIFGCGAFDVPGLVLFVNLLKSINLLIFNIYYV